jgi:hypothetical protein
MACFNVDDTFAFQQSKSTMQAGMVPVLLSAANWCQQMAVTSKPSC